MEFENEPAKAVPLTLLEQRVLGCLIEKAMTTPDAYPMTINGLVTASNQKSNRDPVMSLEDFEVEDGLRALQEKGLVGLIQSGRADRWRHYLYEYWKVSRIELAIMAELFLRGVQTEGELRSRVERMATIGSVEDLRERLAPLRERDFVAYVSPEKSRGATITHRFMENAPSNAQASAAAVPTIGKPSATNSAQSELAELRAEIATLRAAGEQVWGEVEVLKRQVSELRTALGIDPSEAEA